MKRTAKKHVTKKFCASKTTSGEPCKQYVQKGKPFCNLHIYRASPKHITASGIYTTSLDKSLRELEAETIAAGRLDDLKRLDLEQELVIARLQLMEILADREGIYGAKARLTAIDTIVKVAKYAKALKEIDANALRRDFLDSIIVAISFAFQRANNMQDPADRSVAFIREMSQFFPDVTTEGEVIPLIEGAAVEVTPTEAEDD
jgi:hypothetical protein